MCQLCFYIVHVIMLPHQEILKLVFKFLMFYFIFYVINFYTCTMYFQVFTTSSLNLQGRSALDATELAYARQVGLTVNTVSI